MELVRDSIWLQMLAETQLNNIIDYSDIFLSSDWILDLKIEIFKLKEVLLDFIVMTLPFCKNKNIECLYSHPNEDIVL